MIEKQTRLANQMIPYIQRESSRLAESFGVDSEDLWQEGYLAAFRLAKNFREDSRMTYFGWSARHIRRAMRVVAQRSTISVYIPDHHFFTAGVRAVSLIAPFGQDPQSTDTLAEVIPGDEDVVADVVAREIAQRVRAAVSALPERERSVIEARFFAERTLDDVSQEHGLSRERIRQIEKAAVKRLGFVEGIRKMAA